ncbi:MAG: TIGR03790 family protein, partial [Verrucomicrobiota bacterium]
LFNQKQVPSVTQQSVVKVARLDGPDLDAVKRCIDAAVEGERLGVRGRVYIDQAQKSAETDNDWLGVAGEQLEAMGFPATVDKDPALMGWDTRMDATAFYFGWYGRPRESPLGDPSYRFPPGASALHIHSFSAETLRSQRRCWVGAFVHAGVTATMGNVYEPYLQMTHRPQLFVAGLADGMSAGEAAYYAMPFLSWVCVFVGDPLYRPFAVDLSKQLEATSDVLSQYVVLRKMKLMRQVKAFEDAFVFGVEQYKKVGGLALAFHLARQYNLRGVRNKSLEMLDPWLGEVEVPLDEWGLLYEVGRFLESIKQDEKALGVYANLVRLAEGTPEALYVYTPQAIDSARSLGQSSRADAWQAGLTQLRISEEEARLREKLNR